MDRASRPWGFRATPESVAGFRALEEALPAGAAATTDVLVESDPARVDEASGAVAAARSRCRASRPFGPGSGARTAARPPPATRCSSSRSRSSSCC